jgi:hypothetical protein
MDQHLGASITMSFGLVVLFAIALYQPDQTPLPQADPEVTAAKPERPAPTPQAPLPELTPSEPLAGRPSPAAIAPDAGGMRPIATAVSRADPIDPVPHQSSARAPTRQSVPVLPPCDGFTQSLEGETLRDVAIRVYGSSDDAESLWRLNRDLLRRREGILPTGTLLRTP